MARRNLTQMGPYKSQDTGTSLSDELAALRLENEALKARTQSRISMRVSDKGGLSVYGLGRFPVTLYVEQWERLLAEVGSILTFIEEHRAELKTKE